MADAAVTLTTSSRTVATGEDGRFCLFPLEPGEHRLVVFADGYGVAEQVFLVEDQGAARVEIRLRAAFGEEVVISATRTGRRLADVPLQVQTVRRSQIEGVVARTLADAVEWTRGVRVESNCQSCNTSQIRLLGLEGPYSQVLVDGQPTVSSLAMVYGIEQLPARLIDSIEVVRGGGSPAYGAGAVAGVINLIPHHPDHTHVEVSARSSRMGGAGGATRSPSYNLVADLMPGSSRPATFYGQADREAFAGLRYTGRMVAPHYAGYIAEDRLELTPSFLAVDVGVSRRFVLGGDRGIVGTFAVKNLTDEYQQDLDRGPRRDAGYVYGPRFPRSVVVGVKVDL